MAIETPMELLDLQDGGKVEFHILKVERWAGVIKPPTHPDGKEVDVLRVYVRPGEKSHGLPYYDLTAKTLRAQLEPLVDSIIASQRLVRITKRGVAPSARFSVEVV